MEASHSSSVVDGSEQIRGNKSIKLQEEEEEDRISDLPDSLIHHILSLLGSTIRAIQTGILSKRWQNQWARVPVLIFGSPSKSSSDFDENFARFIDNVLLVYDCSKIKKFGISYNYEMDRNVTSKIRFATMKDVEELILHCRSVHSRYMLPKFLFDTASLVTLVIFNCELQLCWRINWASLKVLKMVNCLFSGDYMHSGENVLCGIPSLEILEMRKISWDHFVIFASESLKILVLAEIKVNPVFEISCPNLEKLQIEELMIEGCSIFPVNLLTGTPLLHSLRIMDCSFHEVVIASKSLKKVSLLEISSIEDRAIEILCPNLEEFCLFGLDISTCKFMKFPSSVNMPNPLEGFSKTLVKKILEALQPAKELKVGDWLVKVLSASEVGELSYPLLNIKCLTLDFYSEHISGIVNALCCSPALERLIMRLCVCQNPKTADFDLNNFEEIYRNSNGTVCTCLVSNLKTVKIIGLSERDGNCKVVLHFIEFLLKNAGALEKMVVKLEYGGQDFKVEVSRRLFGVPRCSRRAIVELL